MTTFVVSLFVFFAGLWVGKAISARKAKAREREFTSALAGAWQEGFAAARAAAADLPGNNRTPVFAPGTVPGPAPEPVQESTASLVQEEAQQLAESQQLRIDPGQEIRPGDSASDPQFGAVAPGASGLQGTPEHHGAPQVQQNPVLHGLFPNLAPQQPGPPHQQEPAQWQAPGYRPPVAPAPVDLQVRALRNINITLYVAALLLVASASLFISFALNPSAKVVGLAIVTVGFYAVGLVMRARSQRLRPAAAAFTATGLALLPMTGFAYNLLLPSIPGSVWLVTSILGTVAFMYAAGKLQSRVIAAVGTTFLVSTSVAGGAVLNRGLLFYFLFSMVLASVITVVGMRRPKWLGNIYLQSFVAAHRFLVPAILLASVVSFAIMRAIDYGWLFAATAAYYAISLPLVRKTERYWYQLAARAAAIGSAIAFLVHAEFSASSGVQIVAAIFVAQAVFLAFYARQYLSALRIDSKVHLIEVWVLLGIGAASALARFDGILLGTGVLLPGTSIGDTNWALPVVLVGAALVAYRLGGSLAWTPLGVGLLGIAESGALASGRFLLLLGAALDVTWWLARRVEGASNQGRVEATRLRLAARMASPILVAAFFGFAASGWSWGPKESLFGDYLSGGIAVVKDIDVAGLFGFTIAVVIQVLWSCWVLYRNRRVADTRDNDSDIGQMPVGESAVFAGGLLVAALATAGVGSMFEHVGFANLVGAGWSTEFWLGTDWSRVLVWLVLGVGLMGASTILGMKPVAGVGPETPGNTPESLGQVVPGRVARQLVHLGGAIALFSGLALGAGMNPTWLIEVIAVLALAYLVSRLLAFDSSVPGIVYALAAQLLFSATAWHIADRLNMDGHGQLALIALTTTVPQSARLLAGARIASIKAPGIQLFLNVATLAVLGLVPVVYLGSGTGFLPVGGYDQAALLVQFLCLLLVSVLVARGYASRPLFFNGAGMLAGLSVLGIILTPALGHYLRAGGWLPVPLWSNSVAAVLLVILVAGLLYAEARNLRGSGHRVLRAMMVVLYLGSCFVLAQDLGQGWKIVAGLLGSAGALVFATTLGLPLIVGASVLFLLYAVSHGLDWFREAAGIAGGQPGNLILLLCVAALLLLIAAILGGRFSGDKVSLTAMLQRSNGWSAAHARVLFTAVLLLVFLAGMAGLADDAESMVYLGAILVVISVCVAAALEIPADQREPAFEISGLVAAAVLQRCLWVAFDGLGFFAIAYYWFVVIALLATYEFYRKRESRGVPIMATATGVLSLTGVATILTSTLGEQLVVLLSFSALLVFGLLSNRRLFTLWAAIGIGAAVLWFLRGYTFLLLLLLAAGLIALALWRLGKMNKSSANQQRIPSGNQPPAQHPESESNQDVPVLPDLQAPTDPASDSGSANGPEPGER